VQVDEQHSPILRQHRFCGALADTAAQMIEPVESLRGVDDGAGMRQARLRASEQRFVAIHSAIRSVEDRLIRHPERRHRAIEARFETGAIGAKRAGVAEQLGGLLRDAGHTAELRRLLDDALDVVWQNRLREVAQGAELERLDGRADGRRSSHQDDRNV
jgi:hypothetical protein